MRIVLVNWAKIREGAASGGGVNGYCQGVGLELAARGHEVVSLCGGTSFEAGAGRGGAGEIGPCRVRRLGDWRGIGVLEVVNSPVLAPSLAQFREPLGEVRAPELEAVVRGLMRELKPDAVHFHNIEGFSAGCIGAAREGWPGARIVYSLHNYHTVCPQVYLMQGHRRPCMSYDNGNCCAGCVPAVEPGVLRRRWAREAASRGSLLGLARPAARRARSIARWALRRPGGGAERGKAPPGPALWSAAWFGMPARRPLLNVIQPEPAGDRPANDYAARRAAMVGMLNGCDRVLAVSRFVAEKFASLGVDRDRLRTLHIGTRMTEIAAARPPNPPPPHRDGPRPVRLAFMGYNNWYKGLPMLVESLHMLAPEVLGRVHLTVLALEGEPMERELRALGARSAGLVLRFGYDLEELPGLIGGADLGVVPSVWWDNGPQTVMEYLACGVPVLGAELGGIPDFVRDGENGLLFRGNDRWDLARRIVEIVREPARLDRLRAGVRPPKSIAEHTTELEAEYAPLQPIRAARGTLPETRGEVVGAPAGGV
jgi:hypothetical protein